MNKKIKLTALTLLCLCALCNETYAEESGSGFSRFTSFFSEVKQKIVQAIEQKITPYFAKKEAPKPTLPNPQNEPTTEKTEVIGSSTLNGNFVSPKKEFFVTNAEVPEVKSIEKLFLGKKFEVISENVVAIRPFLLKNDVVIPNPTDPSALNLKTTKNITTLAPTTEEKQTEKTRSISLTGMEEVKDLKSFTQTNLKPLQPLPEIQLLVSTPLERDHLEILKGLIHWITDPILLVDESSRSILSVYEKTKSRELKQLSLAFIGWMLNENAYPALGGLVLDQSLRHSSLEKYDNQVLKTLSMLAEKSVIPKKDLKNIQIKNEKTLSNDALGFLQLVRAEEYFDNKKYDLARKTAFSVPEKSSSREKARFLASLSLISSKDSTENYTKAGKELTDLFKVVNDSDLFDATAVTLGRIHFILGNYKAAHQYLNQVSRDTNVFIEAAIDNAWSLLRLGDRNHAVGNMFTLHTPYFDGAYMPESYFVQGLGYQDLCQFGDALTGIKQYKARYLDAFKKIESFNKNQKHGLYYDDLKSYLTKQEHQMPDIISRELARHPDFIKRQGAMNAISRESRNLKDKFILSHNSVLKIVENRADSLKQDFAKDIEKFLAKRSNEVQGELQFLTANMALLEYEIFAGAGNNLALQGAQNFAVDEKEAVRKPADTDGAKEYWPYEDEIWEDELNHFRSKMVDGCAKLKQPS